MPESCINFIERFINDYRKHKNPSFTIYYDEHDRKLETLDNLRTLKLYGYVYDVAPMINGVSFTLTQQALERFV